MKAELPTRHSQCLERPCASRTKSDTLCATRYRWQKYLLDRYKSTNTDAARRMTVPQQLKASYSSCLRSHTLVDNSCRLICSGTQFTCFTGTKAQILRPDELLRPHSSIEIRLLEEAGNALARLPVSVTRRNREPSPAGSPLGSLIRFGACNNTARKGVQERRSCSQDLARSFRLSLVYR